MTIAIVGSGIAGLAAARTLAGRVPVELFEAAAEPGGHTRTVDVGAVALDTGFIVHNARDYPRLTALLRELGVAVQPADMSFSVECACGVAWSSRAPWQAGPRLLREIGRFLRRAPRSDPGERTLARYLDEEGYSPSFAWHYAAPMTAALWSTAPGDALQTPAMFVVDFMRSHGMLGARRHRWSTAVGGARGYVHRLLERLAVPVHLATPVRGIRRSDDVVTIATDDGTERTFDGVVVATSAPVALTLLRDPSDDERRLLGAFATTRNDSVLHTDARLLPRNPRTRAAWNYTSAGCGVDAPAATVTYSLNRLQRLSVPVEYCVTLNRRDAIDPAHVVQSFPDTHPRITFAALAAQRELHHLDGVRRTAFAGAWQGNGFHEDGLVSGERAAKALLA